MAEKPKTFDEVLISMPDDKRAELERLRQLIHSVAPGAEEYISYGLAAFKMNRKPLVALGAASSHCAFYPMNGTTVDAFKDDLKDYQTSKGTIRFTVDRPLPDDLVIKIVRARISENSA